MKWTKEQQKVIDYRKGTLLVSAAAGSGKTAVLVQRILTWILEEEKNIDEFLIVTFTRAAASQMRTKLRRALEQLQEQYPDNQHIIRQLSLIHRASIMTIDSFCKQVVDDNFQILGIDPAMRILDDTEGVLLQEDVLSVILEKAYETQPEAMLLLHQYMKDVRSDDNIRQLLKQLRQQAESVPDSRAWLAAARKDAEACGAEAIESCPWMQLLIQGVKDIMEDVRQIPEKALEEYRCLPAEYQPKAYDKYSIYFQEECQMIQAVMQAATYSELQQAFDKSGRIYKRFIWKNAGIPEEHYVTELWQKYSACKKEAAGYVQATLAEIEEQQSGVAPVLLTILSLTEQFMDAYLSEKQKKNCMDFGDVEHYALQVLTRREDKKLVSSEVAKQMQGMFTEILIDEYQDSNDLQEAILTSIARQTDGEYANLFMVGDMKQSIYKFRMARPQLFQKTYQEFSGNLEDPGISKKIELMQNFRSRKEVLESVNFLFYQLMTVSMGGVDYNQQTALVPGREFAEQSPMPDYRTEIYVLDALSEQLEEADASLPDEEISEEKIKEAQGDEPDMDVMEQEARFAAAKIRRLCDAKQPLPIWDDGIGAYRACTYRDIVILLRTVKGWSETFRQILMEEGIPAYAESSKGYFDSVEVKNLLCALAVIDNARDDIALAGTLRSPLAGITSEELAYLRAAYREGNLWEILQRYVNEWEQPEQSQLYHKLKQFLECLEGWKEYKTYSSIRELIWRILDETGYYQYVAAMPRGRHRQENILKLMEKASLYEATSYHGLFDFLRYIERMKVSEQDFGEAVVMGENDNLVRIMTIHKSKGLEFPVVLLCGCGKQFNQKDAENPVLIDADGYLGINYKHVEEHYYEKTVKRNCLAKHMKEENIAEELRILYVAMTRAKEKLIMIGSIDARTAKSNEEYHLLRKRYQDKAADLQETSMQVYKPLGKQRVTKCNSYLAWLIITLLQIQNQGTETDSLRYQIVERSEMDWQTFESWNRLQERSDLWKARMQESGNAELYEAIRTRFEWQYAHPMAVAAKGKLSVSEIKKMSQQEELEAVDTLPELTEKKKMPKHPTVSAGAEYGTLMHLAMEKLSFQKGESLQQVEQEIQELVQQKVLTPEQGKRISASRIYHMMHSGLGQRMAQAQQRNSLYREQQFVIGLPMHQVYKTGNETDLELVQGVIDAYFEEDGELVLLDYKTDTVSEEQGAEELIKRYHAQLEYYKQTLEQLTGKCVKETYIYSFYLNQVIPMPFDLTERKKPL